MQSKQDKQQEPQSRLSLLKARVTSQKQDEVGFDGVIYQLARELGCLGDLIGREYKFTYDENGKLVYMMQLPIRINQLLTLIAEAKKDEERQERAMKSKRKR